VRESAESDQRAKYSATPSGTLPPSACTSEVHSLAVAFTDNDGLTFVPIQVPPAQAAGFVVTYWQQDEAGRWQKKA